MKASSRVSNLFRSELFENLNRRIFQLADYHDLQLNEISLWGKMQIIDSEADDELSCCELEPLLSRRPSLGEERRLEPAEGQKLAKKASVVLLRVVID